MLRKTWFAAGLVLAASAPAWAQTVTPAQPAAGQAGQSVVAPPAESLVPGTTGASGEANVVLPPAESLTPGANQTVLPPAESIVQGAPGGFPAATATGTGTATTTTGTGTTATGTIGTGLTVPPAISAAQAAQGALQQGGLAPIVTETGVPSTTQVAMFGDRESLQQLQQQRRRETERGGGAAIQGVPIGTSPGSRPGAPQYIGAEVTPYDPDVPDALDFSRTP